MTAGRHPSARWAPDLSVCVARLAAVLDAEGATWPEVAAAALTARGAAGVTTEEWAALLRVPGEVVASAEAGELAATELPAVLARALALPAAAGRG